MSAKRTQPTWCTSAATMSDDERRNELQIYNSLTRCKNVFIPAAADGRRVNWYNCGPTVYDASHMGHARSYITFDIIRRILRDYFRYDVFFVQNVTDIDDKIIRRARQTYLFERYAAQTERETLLEDTTAAIRSIRQKAAAEGDADKRKMFEKMATSAEVAICDDADLEPAKLAATKLRDVLSIWLDETRGSGVTDNQIFVSLPRRFEHDYNEDMRALNILPPDCVTRVSEYVPEIVDYVTRIIGNGFAYVSAGSVYFDTEKFAQTDRHFYAKLVPEAYGDSAALAEGEGDLKVGEDEKRNPNDFALWKSSKAGEPSWPSPWGAGRPGWHIECSVMASAMFGAQMDIHSGGVDLRFPHHDNEMAQAEAYFDTGRPWVNYFLHSGHLTISGCKMSKSLKNFITIKDALRQHSARQLRIAFLLHSWKDTLDYSENTMTDAVGFEKTINEFFLTVKDILRRYAQLPVERKIVKWNDAEKSLHQKYKEHVDRLDRALKDNFDTKSACDEIRRLISASNVYIHEKQDECNCDLLANIARYVTRMMNIFGCGSFGEPIGFCTIANEDGALASSSNESANREQTILPFLDVISTLRQEIRAKARELKCKELFTLCDQIRDDILPMLGVRMEDYETDAGLRTRLKLVDKEILLREREERLRMEAEKRREKSAKCVAPTPSPPIAPDQLFRRDFADRYSRFDERGSPTHDHEGKELSKSALKKIAKIYQSQEKKYNDYLRTLSAATNSCAQNGAPGGDSK